MSWNEIIPESYLCVTLKNVAVVKIPGLFNTATWVWATELLHIHANTGDVIFKNLDSLWGYIITLLHEFTSWHIDVS